MKLSPLNIQQQEFTRGIKGYKIEEVRSFLESVADAFESLNAENNDLKKEVENLKRKNDEFKKIERSLQDTLLSAQESSSKAVETAKARTTTLIKEAEEQASGIVENAKKEADGIREAVTTLRQEKDMLISRLKGIIEAQAALLNISFTEENNSKAKTGKVKEENSDKNNINVDEIVEKLL